MMKRITAVAALFALFALSGRAIAAGRELTTQVTATFVEAVYFYDYARVGSTGGMDIDFGELRLPSPGNDVLVPASDGSHALSVVERRSSGRGNWSVSAQMSAMSNGDGSFDGALRLYDPACSLTLTLTGAEPDQYVLIDTSLRKIVEAWADVTEGTYNVMATAGNTRIMIPAAAVEELEPVSYAGTVTWTLTLTP